VRRYWAVKGKPEKRSSSRARNGYHGSTMGGGSLGGMAGIHAQGGMIDGIVHIDQPDWWARAAT
jgi:putrescine---pyruvate transaminase